ncbi:MAG: superoxide dismutase [Paludibacter sp.]|jgi:Fe-Mn family superoxide dismutase|nr:superoxide dismutase [Paludibacter sp.]
MRKNAFIFTMLMVAFSLSAQYQLPKLAYSYSALEPYIDSATMYIHYNNHHGAYTKNLNDALAKYPELQKKPINELFANMDEIPADIKTSVRNNGGGYYNHVLFWELLIPASQSVMTPFVEAELKKAFGSIDTFKTEFEKAAATRFGSGWAWLIKDKTGAYRIVSTPNQDNTLMSLNEAKGHPVLALDVWEHAYYLKYQSKRAEYVKNFWKIVNWKKVEELMKK